MDPSLNQPHSRPSCVAACGTVLRNERTRGTKGAEGLCASCAFCGYFHLAYRSSIFRRDTGVLIRMREAHRALLRGACGQGGSPMSATCGRCCPIQWSSRERALAAAFASDPCMDALRVECRFFYLQRWFENASQLHTSGQASFGTAAQLCVSERLIRRQDGLLLSWRKALS